MKLIKKEVVAGKFNGSKKVLQALELRIKGLTLQEIGEKMRVSKQRVEQLLQPPKDKIVYHYLCEDTGETFVSDKKIKPEDPETVWLKKKLNVSPRFNIQEIFKGKPKWKAYGRERTREIVRFRDRYICQDCGYKWQEGERALDVHHLNGECGKNSKGYDSIKDIDNLITLCHKCHYNRPDHTIRSKNKIKMPNPDVQKKYDELLKKIEQAKKVKKQKIKVHHFPKLTVRTLNKEEYAMMCKALSIGQSEMFDVLFMVLKNEPKMVYKYIEKLAENN